MTFNAFDEKVKQTLLVLKNSVKIDLYLVINKILKILKFCEKSNNHRKIINKNVSYLKYPAIIKTMLKRIIIYNIYLTIF